MPISYRIDHDRRIVLARGHGTFSDEDVFGYQREVWSGEQVAGYAELVDMTLVTRIEVPSAQRIRELARTAAGMDHASQSSRFAIVAPTDLAYGLGRMFQTYRSMNPQSKKEVAVFRTMDEALKFLEVDPSVEFPEVTPA